MISYTGISIFIFGNTIEKGKIVLADGVKKEFEISLAQNSIVVPIGATGYISKELWSETITNYVQYFGSNNFIDLFKELGNETTPPDALVKLIIDFLNKLIKK